MSDHFLDGHLNETDNWNTIPWVPRIDDRAEMIEALWQEANQATCLKAFRFWIIDT
jgi:hypothetical protein